MAHEGGRLRECAAGAGYGRVVWCDGPPVLPLGTAAAPECAGNHDVCSKLALTTTAGPAKEREAAWRAVMPMQYAVGLFSTKQQTLLSSNKSLFVWTALVGLCSVAGLASRC